MMTSKVRDFDKADYDVFGNVLGWSTGEKPMTRNVDHCTYAVGHRDGVRVIFDENEGEKVSIFELRKQMTAAEAREVLEAIPAEGWIYSNMDRMGFELVDVQYA